jgi:hypothetical protein
VNASLVLDNTPTPFRLKITSFKSHGGRLELMNREKWDEWFRDLAYNIVDVKVSGTTSDSGHHKYARMG